MIARAATEVPPPQADQVEVDFCRGPAGAFLAIDMLVVAGDCTGGSRTIMSFAVDRAQMLRALTRGNSLGQASEPIATERRE